MMPCRGRTVRVQWDATSSIGIFALLRSRWPSSWGGEQAHQQGPGRGISISSSDTSFRKSSALEGWLAA